MRVEDCPCDKFGQTRAFKAWKGFSVWPQPSTALPSKEAKMIDYYHLHPEMVETKSDGDGYKVKLCTSCAASIKKNEDPPLCPSSRELISDRITGSVWNRCPWRSGTSLVCIDTIPKLSRLRATRADSGSTPRAASRDAQLCSTMMLREFVRSFSTRKTCSLISVFTS